MTLNRTIETFVLALIVSIVSLSSCITTDKTLASIYIPTNQDIHIQSSEIDLPVGLKVADSLQTAVSTAIMMGAINSPEFGMVRIGSAASITPADDSVDFGKNPEFLGLTLQIGTYSTQTLSTEQDFISQNVYAYPLKIELDSTHIYNNSIKESDYDHTPISKYNTLFMGNDSLNVNFTKEFGEKFLTATREELDSTELFMKRFYGIYFETDVPEEGLIGGRLNQFDLSTASLVLSFTSTNYEGKRRDTSIALSLGAYYFVNSVKVSTQHLETNDASDVIYAEGISGLKPHIDAKQLRKSIEVWATNKGIDLSQLLIAKAIIELPYEYSGNYHDLDYYPSALFPCQKSVDTTQTYYSPISEIYDTNFSNGTINRSLSCYQSDIGMYLQKLIAKDASQIDASDDLWMMSIISYTSETTSETYYLSDYSSYFVGILNGTKAARHPKLKISYTLLR